MNDSLYAEIGSVCDNPAYMELKSFDGHILTDMTHRIIGQIEKDGRINKIQANTQNAEEVEGLYVMIDGTLTKGAVDTYKIIKIYANDTFLLEDTEWENSYIFFSVIKGYGGNKRIVSFCDHTGDESTIKRIGKCIVVNNISENDKLVIVVGDNGNAYETYVFDYIEELKGPEGLLIVERNSNRDGKLFFDCWSGNYISDPDGSRQYPYLSPTERVVAEGLDDLGEGFFCMDDSYNRRDITFRKSSDRDELIVDFNEWDDEDYEDPYDTDEDDEDE